MAPVLSHGCRIKGILLFIENNTITVQILACPLRFNKFHQGGRYSKASVVAKTCMVSSLKHYVVKKCVHRVLIKCINYMYILIL
jgi:hypothetical protein